MKYIVIRTDTADALIRNIVLYIAENFGNEIALNKLDDLEKSILELEDNPYIGTEPRYTESTCSNHIFYNIVFHNHYCLLHI